MTHGRKTAVIMTIILLLIYVAGQLAVQWENNNSTCTGGLCGPGLFESLFGLISLVLYLGLVVSMSTIFLANHDFTKSNGRASIIFSLLIVFVFGLIAALISKTQSFRPEDYYKPNTTIIDVTFSKLDFYLGSFYVAVFATIISALSISIKRRVIKKRKHEQS